MNRELLHLHRAVSLGNSSNSRQSSLRDDGDTGTLGVLLGQGGQLLGDFGDIGDAPAVAFGVGESFGFVSDQVVNVWNHAVELVLEELGDEWGGEGEDKGLWRLSVTIIKLVIRQRPTLFLEAASSASNRTAGTDTVRW